jgi:hypothetical protein
VDVILGHVVLPGIRRVAHLAGGEAGEILVSYAARWSGWRLSVSDNGPGFAEVSDERPHTPGPRCAKSGEIERLRAEIVRLEDLKQKPEAAAQRLKDRPGRFIEPHGLIPSA